ncbi:heptosyltransferase-2 [Succinivibrio dextrinosolvens]|uniref:lipopolysaccharide heptosyltransferase II n=1 Tax=Succinivibrio dextrinosolvens TaxID=83771 RepID=UPI0008E5304F|nr:lipopolysaccharide heptosyltransferase II [Succinivibrio dextrinosolvens]SFS43822.1 heptosyltransferase-2 [Succinivibrio dextrinosolvens]
MTLNTHKKYLIISPSWLGDLIMSQSLYKVLKEQDPECIIDIYAPAYTMPILDRMPELSGKFINPFEHGAFNLKQRYAEGKKFRDSHYDSVFILPNSLKSAFVGFFAKIPDRRGFKGESRYILINNMRTNKQDFPLMVQRYVALAFDRNEVKTAQDLPKFSYPKLETRPLDEKRAAELGLDFSKKNLILGCGANYGPSKLWPVEYFAEISMWWIKKGGRVIGIGSKKDIPTVAKIYEHLSEDTKPFFTDIAGKTNLTEALDIVGSSTAAVCNDSGLMHTVAAADVPQVCIFGSTSTNYTPPLSDKAVCVESDEPCHPCFKRTCKFETYACLKKLTPQMVIEKLEQLLSF